MPGAAMGYKPAGVVLSSDGEPACPWGLTLHDIGGLQCALGSARAHRHMREAERDRGARIGDGVNNATAS